MKFWYTFIFLPLVYTCIGYACPSCIGKLDDEHTPPFFNAEFYNPSSPEKVKEQLAHGFDEFEKMVNETTQASQE